MFTLPVLSFVKIRHSLFTLLLCTGAVLAGLPVAIAYLLFQKRVTQAITLSAGIKG